MVRETPANLSCEPREGPPQALQLSSNRREREVGQVPAGVERILALAPGEPWFRSELQPEREAAQRQNGRWDLRKEEGDIRSTASSPKGRTQPACAISQASLVWCSGHSLQSLFQTPPSLGLQARALTSSMKRTIVSAGLKGPMDHCPVQSSWPRFQNGQLEAQEALTIAHEQQPNQHCS